MSARQSTEKPVDGAGKPMSSADGPSPDLTFERSYAPVPASARAARAAVAEFARSNRVADATIEAVTLAVSEAVTNVVVHAHLNQTERPDFRLTAALAGPELWVIVTDSGSGLQARRDSPGLGLGLAIIARVADGVDLVTSASGGLEIRMRFAVTGAPAAC